MTLKTLSMRNRPVGAAAFVARTLVASLFILTGVAKIIDIHRFVEEVRKYELLPLSVSNSVAYVVPWLEVLAGTLLLFCIWRSEARWIVAAMLVTFTVAKVWAFARGLNIECGCGGQIALLKTIFDLPQGILTNLGLLAVLALDSYAERRALRGPEDRQPLAPPKTAVADPSRDVTALGGSLSSAHLGP